MPKTVLFAGAHSQLGWSWLLSVLGAPGSGLPPISPSKSRRAITDLSLGHCRVERSCHRFCLFLFSSLSKPNHPHHEDKPGIKPGRKRFSKKHVVLSNEGTWPTSKTFHTPQKPHTVNLFFCFPSLRRADNCMMHHLQGVMLFFRKCQPFPAPVLMLPQHFPVPSAFFSLAGKKNPLSSATCYYFSQKEFPKMMAETFFYFF